ncbi:hypothetical protein DA075_10170 [Methylobacterium currus]|uniref:Uncharacterized protein n=1 Tax=Methylobacterium currus TaxID=2051553 RepID=A0A2R4WI60_9HYPH|nr:hypothetical protein [Methylobacterium currus]AWB21232.1 hypothetical protein DA075_10170 [Methylobacterium currus]
MGAARLKSQRAATGNTVTAARDVVTVGCKLPGGLIMREFVEAQETEVVQGGPPRQVAVHQPTGQQITILGTGARIGLPPPILVRGYRLTPNVPKALWDGWLAANRNSDMVRNGLIYASPQQRDVEAFAREHETARTGLEGIDPDNPGARVRGIQRGDKPK